MAKKSTLDWIALILLIIGGLNWGLVIFDSNIVTMLFGAWPIIATIIYALVGLSALYTIYYLFKN